MPVREYKKAEKELTGQITSCLRRFWDSARTFLDYTMRKGTQRFTVMRIPHSVKKIFTFQVSFFTLVFGTSTFGILLVGFALLAAQFDRVNEINRRLTRERDRSSKTLESLKDEIASIRSSGKNVKASMDGVVSAIDSRDTNRLAALGPVAASFPALPDALSCSADGARELSDLKTLASLLSSSSGFVNRATNALAVFRDLMANAPTPPMERSSKPATPRTWVPGHHRSLDRATPGLRGPALAPRTSTRCSSWLSGPRTPPPLRSH